METNTKNAVNSHYLRLCETVDIKPITKNIILDEFTNHNSMIEHCLADRITAALQIFLELVASDVNEIEKIDKVLLDYYIAEIDNTINSQLDAILHHSEFQKLESLWRSLKYLIDHTDFNANIKCELLDVDKEMLRQDFEEITDITLSGLYKHAYIQEYDTPGGEPIAAMISQFEFDASNQDIHLLKNLAKISSVTHCPLIANVSPKFFHKDSFDEVMRIDDLMNYMDRTEYIHWNSFRESDDARYVGLLLPKFLLRLPYGDNNYVRHFNYQENVTGQHAENYLWGNASFAFAANMVRSFKLHGWMVNIRGNESGGKVENLPIHYYTAARGRLNKIPTECIIPDTRELEFANCGFIPLSYYKNSDFACFFSANSTQKSSLYSNTDATANSRMNSKLPYIFLSSRIAHYLKVLQRENIGSNKNRLELENELNLWLQTLVTKMNNPGPELAATHPLREGKVFVEEIIDNPGFYRVLLHVMPHFQIEGFDVTLSLVAQMPTGKK